MCPVTGFALFFVLCVHFTGGSSVGALGRLRHHRVFGKSVFDTYLVLNLKADFRICCQEILRVLASLTDLAASYIPGAAFSTMFSFAARSRISPHGNTFPNMISNSASRNGGAILFFTTLMRTRFQSLRRPASDSIRQTSEADIHADRRIELGARPPVVTSGFPNMIPTFSRSWLIKITIQFERLIAAVSFLSACDIRRACRPTWNHPSHRQSAFEPVRQPSPQSRYRRTGAHHRLGNLKRLLAVVRLEIYRLSISTPIFFAYADRVHARIDKSSDTASSVLLPQGNRRLPLDSGPYTR